MSNIEEGKKLIEAAIHGASKHPGNYEKRLINNSIFGLHFKGSPNLYFANFHAGTCEVAVDNRDGQPHEFLRVPTSALKEIIAGFDTAVAGWPGGRDKVKEAIGRNVTILETADSKFLDDGISNAFGPTDLERYGAINRMEEILLHKSNRDSMIVMGKLTWASERLYHAAGADPLKAEAAFIACKAHSFIPAHSKEADTMLARAFHLRKTVPDMEERVVNELKNRIPLSANATQEELKEWAARAELLHELASAPNSDTISRQLAKMASFAAAQCYNRIPGETEKTKKWKAIHTRETPVVSQKAGAAPIAKFPSPVNQSLTQQLKKGMGGLQRP